MPTLSDLVDVLLSLITLIVLSYTAPIESPQTSSLESTLSTASAEAFLVTRVVDGDTLKVASDETELTVRLIGINTPETKDPRKPVECFGEAASKKMQNLVENKTVLLSQDSSQSERDRYNRLLRYVALPSGEDVGEILIREGYAQEYTYNSPYAKQDLYQAAEISAQNEQRGLWNPTVCPEN